MKYDNTDIIPKQAVLEPSNSMSAGKQICALLPLWQKASPKLSVFLLNYKCITTEEGFFN